MHRNINNTFRSITYSIAVIILFISLGSCLRLDDVLFNSNNSIDGYLLDDYTGEVDFRLPEEYKVNEDEITLFTLQSDDAGDKAIIHAIYLGNPETIASDTVIMYCHGNRDHMDFYWHRHKLLYYTGGEKHYGVLMVDYRGYGLSEGKSTEAGIIADVAAGLQWLKDRGLTGDRLIIYGFSLGSVAAVDHAANPTVLTPNKLILEAPVGNMQTMVQDAGGGLSMPSSFFTDLDLDNIEKMKSVRQPLLLFEGLSDVFLTYDTHGKPLYDNHKGAYKELVKIEKGTHTNIPLEYGFEKYMMKMQEFIEK
ncbi:MAG: alpha/beta hydrolase [Chlorobi bacterium]|nr:alpha/beta hydrolase [Chlorobiota bacterium]